MYFVQSLSHIVQLLDPDGNGSINFVQFSEGVKRVAALQGFISYILLIVCYIIVSCSYSRRFKVSLVIFCLLSVTSLYPVVIRGASRYH